MVEIISKSAGQTRTLGKRIGGVLKKGQVVALVGELGTGKTVIAQGIARGLGVSPRAYPRSPSFVLINEYQGRLPVYHFDLYRLNNLRELEDIGYREYFYGQGVTVIEWAEKIEEALPDHYLRVELLFKGKRDRLIKLIAFGHDYERITRKIK